MQDKESIIIKPNIPYYFLGLAFLFLSLSVFLFSSKHFDTPMGILATCFIGISLLICWMIDKGYMNVEISSDKIKLKGYFSIQKIEYTHSEIEGYQLNEVVDQFHSLHQQIRLKTNAGKIIVFPKVAYENYPFLIESITNKYKFMNLEPLRFANFYKKTLPLIAALSGLLYLLKILFNLIE